MFIVGLVAFQYELTVGILTFEDYYLYSSQFNKPYTKFVAVSCGMFTGLWYLRILEYRNASDSIKKTQYSWIHFIKQSKIATVVLYVYALGMLMFVTGVPLTANQDAYSWTKAQNTAYYVLGRFAYCTSMMAFLTIIFLEKGELIRKLLGHELWIPFSRLTFAAYLIYPIVIAFNFYLTDGPIFIGYISVIYFMLSNIVICYLLALGVYLILEAPIRNVINLISGRLVKGKLAYQVQGNLHFTNQHFLWELERV